MSRAVAFSLLILLAAACQDGSRTTPVESVVPVATPVSVRLEISDTDAKPGARIFAAVRLPEAASDNSLAGLQGTLRFDQTRLRFAGQIAEPPLLSMIGDRRASEGVLRILAVNSAGLPDRVAVLAFDVLATGYIAGLAFDGAHVVTRALADRAVTVLPGVAALTDRLPQSGDVERLGVAEWDSLLAPDLPVEARVPGQIVPGLRYGDVTLNGSINVLDVVAASDVAVGMADLLINPSVDVVVAGNVSPANLPGLGEPGDPLPPGRNNDGSLGIDVLDVVAISDEAVGLNPPVVGDPIPGRVSPLGADRRVVVAGNIASDRTFFRDSVYELQGTVNVPGSVTLTIQSGTLIEGDVGTRGALSIRRGGHIQAVGTRLQPVIFSCNAATKTPGCWGGISVNGFSLLNNDDGVGAIGCPEKEAPGGAGIYGGCLIEDGSGAIRYVRIEYAGMAPAGGQAVAGLALLGAGSGTVVDSVQVHASLGDGIFVSGGTVGLRNLLLTANSGSGLRWDDGWVGRVQFLAVQQWIGGGALRGSNYSLDPDAGPRSHPQIYQATLIGPSSTPGGGVFLEHGTALTLRDAIVVQAGTGLDIDGAETCVQTTTMGIDVTNSIFFAGSPDFSDDDDCVDESVYGLEPSRANVVVDPQIKAPFNTLTPDLRAVSGSPVETGYMSPPADLFFDTTQPFIGAIAPANGPASNVPWYAGWTRGWSGNP